ncbi:MAG: Gfo/Idh/MocA family protein [Thermomicrobiales bacterium]
MYRVGIIGLGRISSTIDDEVQGNPAVMLPYSHMACYRDVSAVEVVAGADPFLEQREDFRRRWGVENLYAGYREMLVQERLDIVSVATSAKPQPEIVIDCAKAGTRLIFAEKPLAISLAEADAMLAACREHGVKMAVGCTRRWSPYWSAARDLIAAGGIGRVLQVNGFGRAGISHNGSHLVDLIRFLAGGDVEWVVGEAESDAAAASGDDFMANGYLAFDNGVRAFARTWPSGGAEWNFEVIGESGRLRSVANGSELAWWQNTTGDPLGNLIRRPFPMPQRIESPGVRAVRDFITCLESDKQPECAGEDGLAALEIAIALRESHLQGNCRVDLPLADRALAIRSAETLAGDMPVALRRR